MAILLAATLLCGLTPARSGAAGMCACCSTSVREVPDRWLAMDKFWHVAASFATVGASYHLADDRLHIPDPASTGIALGGTFTIGVAKEFYDLAGPGHHFSWKDLAADGVGIGLGYLAFIHRF